MGHLRFRKPSASLIISIAALIFAMTGTAVAASHLVSGDGLIKKDSLSGNRLRNHSITSTEVAPLKWHNLTLIDGWVAYGTGYGYSGVQYAKDAEGFVHLRGDISGVSETDAVIGTLPAGYRPKYGAWFALGESNGAFNPYPDNAVVFRDGEIDIAGGTGATQTFVSFDSSEFSVG